jgi:hypothetical protein
MRIGRGESERNKAARGRSTRDCRAKQQPYCPQAMSSICRISEVSSDEAPQRKEAGLMLWQDVVWERWAERARAQTRLGKGGSLGTGRAVRWDGTGLKGINCWSSASASAAEDRMAASLWHSGAHYSDGCGREAEWQTAHAGWRIMQVDIGFASL